MRRSNVIFRLKLLIGLFFIEFLFFSFINQIDEKSFLPHLENAYECSTTNSPISMISFSCKFDRKSNGSR